MGKRETWKPAIDFSACYLSVYPGKKTRVFMTHETYSLLGRPKGLAVSLEGDVIVLSPARCGIPVQFSRTGQPYIRCPQLGAHIGPGGRAVFDYDEQTRDERGRFVSKFYFKKAKQGAKTPCAG